MPSNAIASYEGSMIGPVPAITEAAAMGETAAIFTDIRQVLNVDVVNLIWRHLATIDGALPLARGTLRPFYVDGSVRRESMALRGELALRPAPAIPAEVFAGLGLGADDLEADGRLEAAIQQAQRAASARVDWLPVRLGGSAVLPPALAARISAAIEPFIEM
jgi:hypothetical protein